MSKVQQVLDKILEAFRTNKIPKAIAITQFPLFEVPMNKWSFLNRLICYIQGSEDFRGFRQWQEVYRFVKKGEKATFILVPLMKKEEKEDETAKLYGFKGSPVFSVGQTDGKELDYQQLILPELPLLEKARSWGLKVIPIGGNKEMYGYFSQSRNEIGLATNEERVLFHELSHYSHSQVIKGLKGGQDPWQEIVAELSALALCHLVGKTADSQLGNSYEYIEYYAGKLGITPETASLKVLNEVNLVLQFILKED